MQSSSSMGIVSCSLWFFKNVDKGNNKVEFERESAFETLAFPRVLQISELKF